MENNIFKALNRGVKSQGYDRFHISKKTLLEMREMLITNPNQLLEFLDLAITVRCLPQHDNSKPA